jgi:hypothetical protein
MSTPQRIFVVGRHEIDLGAQTAHVVGSASPTFPAESEACVVPLTDIFAQARYLDAAVVFQALPAQVIVALWRLVARDTRVGFVVSKPGKRTAAEAHTWAFTTTGDARMANDAILAVHPNAKVTTNGSELAVTVDPPMRFAFSHIEWL